MLVGIIFKLRKDVANGLDLLPLISRRHCSYPGTLDSTPHRGRH